MQLSISDIQNIIAEIETPENQTRKKGSIKSYEVYGGGLKKYAETRIREMYPDSWRAYTIADYSLLKKIVDKKAKAYKEAVIRQLPTPNESSEYQRIAKDFALNEAMKGLDQIYNQHKYALFGCLMSLEEGTGEPEFNFMALEPHEFDVIKDDEGEAKVVILSYPDRSIIVESDTDGRDSYIAGPKADEGSETKVYAFWTETNFYLVEQTMNGGKAVGPASMKPIESNPNNINPWGVLPFVYIPMHDGPNYPIPSPLADQTIEINALLSVYLTSGNMQIGQLALSYPGDQKVTMATHGLMVAMKLPQSTEPGAPKTEANYISPSPNMEGHRTSIMTFVSMVMDEQGIRSASAFDSTGEKFSSGLDRAISEADVQDLIESNQQLYARVEEEIFEIIRAQLTSVGRNPFSSDEIRIIYKKPKLLVTDTEVLNNIKLMTDLGLLEEWEKFVIVDPNMTEEDAKAKLDRMREEQIAANGGVEIQKTALNGAQVSSMVEIVQAVASGLLPRSAGVNILGTAFQLPPEEADRIMADAGSTFNINPAALNASASVNVQARNSTTLDAPDSDGDMEDADISGSSN